MSFLKHRAIIRLFLNRPKTRSVSLKWLVRTHTRLFQSFLAEHEFLLKKESDDFIYVVLDGKTFVWPARADLERLKHLLAELTTEGHPHRYDFGRTMLAPNEVVLDVGCCEGGFAAKAAEEGAIVIAVEPSRMMGTVIRRLFEVRGLPTPEIKECLLGPNRGLAHFVDDVRDPARSQISETALPGSYPVPVRTIDELTAELPRKPTYIKCDAEGADFGILQGAHCLLGEFHPKVAVTTYHHTNDFERIGTYLRSLGYSIEGKGFLLVEDELRVVMLHAA